MKLPESSQRKDRKKPRWQDRVFAGFWVPFRLIFSLWVFLTPGYEKEWSLPAPSSGRQSSRQRASASFLLCVLMATTVFSFTLFAFLALPLITSRILLILAFGFGFRHYRRMKSS